MFLKFRTFPEGNNIIVDIDCILFAEEVSLAKEGNSDKLYDCVDIDFGQGDHIEVIDEDRSVLDEICKGE